MAYAGCLLRGQFSEGCKVCVCCFQINAVKLRTCGYSQVSCRCAYAAYASPTRKLTGLIPYVSRDGQFGKHLFEFAQYLFLPFAAGAVPEFQPHNWTPAGLALGQSTFDARANGLVAIRT